jgi:type VI secretion system VasD/TssJ family lipoprotein
MVRASLSLVSLLLVATACSSIKNYELGLRGSADLNKNEDNQPNPVQIRVLRLKGEEAAKVFAAAAFDDLWGKPSDVAGIVLDGPVQSIYVPAEDKRVTIALSEVGPAVTHVGVLGLFNRPESGKERLLLTKDQLGSDVLLRGSAITLGDGKTPPAPAPRQN